MYMFCSVFFVYLSKIVLRLAKIKDINFIKNNCNKHSLFFYSNYTFLVYSYLTLSFFYFFKFLNIKKFKYNFFELLENKNVFINFLNNSFWISIIFFNISWSFFFLLLVGFFFLINSENFFFESIFDTSWINNFFFLLWFFYKWFL